MKAVIMAGGAGKRFWPLSRKSNPKQFLSITSERSMIQLTVDRLLGKMKIEDIFVVTSAFQAKLVKQHIPEMPIENIIIEPFGRNTAPCIALSAQYLARKCKADETMFVLPADHVIEHVEDFLQSLEIAEKAAMDNNLVTFGIKPNYPATGYGYIEAGKELSSEMYSVNQFKEKPDLETAEEFLSEGNYYWNSGMFVWKIETILNCYKKYLPKIDHLLKKIDSVWAKKGIDADLSDLYGDMPKIPVDIGIMEQADNRVIVPVDYGWSDVGGWRALYDISSKDENGNVLKGKNDVIETKNCYTNAQKFVALIGVENLIVVESETAILVADKDRSEKVKKIVENLEANKQEEYL